MVLLRPRGRRIWEKFGGPQGDRGQSLRAREALTIGVLDRLVVLETQAWRQLASGSPSPNFANTVAQMVQDLARPRQDAHAGATSDALDLGRVARHAEGMTKSELLRELDVLVGRWSLQPIVNGEPVPGNGRTTFEWVNDGKFLAQHADADLDDSAPPEWRANSPMPVDTIIGLDDTHETFTMLYADGRQIYRVYKMTLREGVWTVWREAPGFNQRFTGALSGDGNTIDGYWEMSKDGETWERDFDIRYTRIYGPATGD